MGIDAPEDLGQPRERIDLLQFGRQDQADDVGGGREGIGMPGTAATSQQPAFKVVIKGPDG
jgi:hypothetical protein